jgi:multiple sugar transport system permease protein
MSEMCTTRTRRKIRPGKLALLVVLTLGAILMLGPFVWVFSSSLRPFREAVALPPKWFPPAPGLWQLDHYRKLLDGSVPFLGFMKNSLIMSCVITLGMVVNGTMAGYAYARLQFRGSRLMFGMMFIAVMVPVQVTIVPLYKIMSGLGVIDTLWAVTLPSIFGAMCPGLAGAFGIFLMRQFFSSIPRELKEAASIDGAGVFRTFFSVMLPVAGAMVASLAVIVFTFAWNDYFTSFIMINTTAKMPLPVAILATRQPYNTGDQIEFALVTFSILPVAAAFLFGQKWIMQSMIHAGIKG